MIAKQLSLLWITPKWPLPPEDGARRASYNLLRAVTGLGASVDLLALVGEGEEVEMERARQELRLRRVFVLRRPAVPKSKFEEAIRVGSSLLLNPRMPVTLRNYGGSKVRRQFDYVLTGKWQELATSGCGDLCDWDAVIYDGAHTASCRIKSGRYKPESADRLFFYRAHNREAQIWERLAKQHSSGLKKIFLKWQARQMRGFEDSLAKEAASTLTVSEEDKIQFKDVCPASRITAVPIGFEFPPVASLHQDNLSPDSLKQLLFLGRLDWRPNREGLIWLLKEVWPSVVKARGDLRLTIAGSGDYQPLTTYLNQERINFLGRVDDLEMLYKSSLLSLVPIFYGSGTRVKAIEASRFGRACLSTAMGVEGIGLEPGKTYLKAENAKEWVQSLIDLDAIKALDMGRAAWEATKKQFDLSETGKRFLEVIQKHVATTEIKSASA